jgi:predicted anti-sigma-YlaC factor YlaD
MAIGRLRFRTPWRQPPGLKCIQLVELVTDYLEGALTEADRCRFEEHLEMCEGCRAHVEQMHETIRLTGRLTEDSLSPEARDDLLMAFRDWKTGSG